MADRARMGVVWNCVRALPVVDGEAARRIAGGGAARKPRCATNHGPVDRSATVVDGTLDFIRRP